MSISLNLGKQQELGQFLTPSQVARFMASLFEKRPKDVRLLDAGAGAGALSTALVMKWCEAESKPETIAVSAYEVDATLISALERSYAECEAACMRAGIEFRAEVSHADFLEVARSFVRGDLFAAPQTPFNAAILNPPYRKIQGDSEARLLLRSAGIETSNLYTGFLALAAKLLEEGGELVSITPRSFCNGPYFRTFREQFLSTMSLRRIHLLDSRSAAFRKDAVLQENIIVHAVKSDVKPSRVIVSSSRGVPTDDLVECERAYSEIVSPNDPEQFIHLVTDDAQDEARRAVRALTTSLPELGIDVSTGRVVDFRARDFLLPEPQPSAAPLIYPCHFRGAFVEWPLAKSRKPNAIRNTERTQELLINSGNYVLVKRFTSKEERRRIVACIFDPARVPGEKVGFENHLNYFHSHQEGLPMLLAKGLAAYLNSTVVDSYFRQFNGHTQVNATDLRNLPYPTRQQLDELGTMIPDGVPEQAKLDELVKGVLS
ncbi:MAG: Eco57I restriction-modification methylase domain-containing protein [Verrucomicrobiota bacterium]|nr:Eco57I restriction-modification methylase domain-containing protein [Verrucomicrobiota bacterium]